MYSEISRGLLELSGSQRLGAGRCSAHPITYTRGGPQWVLDMNWEPHVSIIHSFPNLLVFCLFWLFRAEPKAYGG